jgi:pyruvate/2-oxoglutarate/acetoin dehydrogenase E1 component
VGSDITLVSYGWQVQECITAAETLEKEGISAEVIDLRTLVPLDYAPGAGFGEKDSPRPGRPRGN